MRRGGIINADLAGALSRMGHTDLVVICDAGLPIPPGPAVVDLAFQFGVPPSRPCSCTGEATPYSNVILRCGVPF